MTNEERRAMEELLAEVTRKWQLASTSMSAHKATGKKTLAKRAAQIRVLRTMLNK